MFWTATDAREKRAPRESMVRKVKPVEQAGKEDNLPRNDSQKGGRRPLTDPYNASLPFQHVDVKRYQSRNLQ